MSAVGRRTGGSIFLILFFGAIAISAYILTSEWPFTLPDIIGFIHPLIVASLLVWYLQRYYHHPDADTLVLTGATGSVFGLLLFLVSVRAIIWGQQTQGGVIVKEFLLTLQMGYGGVIVGLFLGHIYGRMRVDHRQLHQQNRKLETQNDHLDQFASIVSHDLRNPLNVAEGRVELARDECDSEHLDYAEEALGRMEELIGDLLRLAKTGDHIHETAPIDLETTIENCWLNVETADATLVTETERKILADQSQVSQLFENLFRNAVEHGGRDVTITVGELDDGFYVEDDGPGISDEHRDRLFEAGYSASRDGTGFGLSIVKRVAESHGWTIRVTDASEGGARFEIMDAEFVTK
ncbi:HAMP domain-containing sensor histidine kinase [Halorubrum sp. F4]|uniref:sensor histidine kinase n=1 Tax=Halorubrum sp. F4 TaxID=2989715 RepID=UPI00248133C3|nr:HAMP domain-containing sensor histidine kinase [Halorubrum sp. F4]